MFFGERGREGSLNFLLHESTHIYTDYDVLLSCCWFSRDKCERKRERGCEKKLISSNNSIKKIRGSASNADFLIFLFLILSCFNSIPYFIIFSLQRENNNIPILINARCCWKLIFVSKKGREVRNSRRGMLKFSFFF